MNIHTDIKAWQSIRARWQGKTIGFVHTMGHLHAGHLSLLARAKMENEISVAAIFVNPTQFNSSQDYECYPRTITADCELLQQAGVDELLLFSAEALYPDQYQINLSEIKLALELEGKFRPGHFNGMLTIVLKFLNLVAPTRSYYGEKDYQQLMLIKKMSIALFSPVEIVGCPTIRAADGLAYSSRNSRLTARDREKAAHFPKLLMSHLTVEEITAQLLQLGFQVDYIVEQWQRRLGAVWLSDVRLIDNVPIPTHAEISHVVMS